MLAKSLFCIVLLLSLASEAKALCRDDLKELKPRIDRLRTIDPPRYYLAVKWWGRALEAEPGSESECDNFLSRARKALFEPLPQVAGCDGPNAYLPACRNGGVGMGGDGGAVMPIGGTALGAGGGGGGAAPVAPVAPVTAAAPQPFTPPGSVGSPAASGR